MFVDMLVKSIGGSRYILLIVDDYSGDYSGMYFTYFLLKIKVMFSIR